MTNDDRSDTDKRAELCALFCDLGILVAQMDHAPQSTSLTAEGNHHVADLWERLHPLADGYELSWKRE
jgi:hypothetical protein